MRRLGNVPWRENFNTLKAHYPEHAAGIHPFHHWAEAGEALLRPLPQPWLTALLAGARSLMP